MEVFRLGHRSRRNSGTTMAEQVFFVVDASVLNTSALAAELKLGPQRIGARTDGGLQIFLPQDGNRVAWDRSYYEISLEVLTPFLHQELIVGETLLQNKTEQG